MKKQKRTYWAVEWRYSIRTWRIVPCGTRRKAREEKEYKLRMWGPGCLARVVRVKVIA